VVAVKVRSPKTGEIGSCSELTGGSSKVQPWELSEQCGVPRADIFLAMQGSKGSELSRQTVAKRGILK
jgi:hypothetical protein